MADDLMDFSEFDGDENDENADPDVEHAPTLMQTPVVKNSILKQSTKDNLIQLFTPVNKSRKLKVHFTPSIQTPSVNSNSSEEAVSQVGDSCSKSSQVVNTTFEEDEEHANWEERTTILTKQDHEDYCQYAKEFLLDIITNLPVKEEESSADSGIEESIMEVQESPDDDTTPHNSQQILPQPDNSQQILPQPDNSQQVLQQPDNSRQPPAEKTETDECVDVLSEAADLLALLRGQTGSCSELPHTNEVPEPAVSAGAAEEANDCEDEPMDVDVSMVIPQPQENGPTIDHDEIIATAEDDKLTKSPGKESLVPEMQPIDDGSDNEPKSHKSEESNIEQDINQVKDQIGNEETGSDVDIDLGTKLREEIVSNVENDSLKTQVVEIFDEGSEVSNKTEAVDHNPVSIVVTDAENVSSVVENAESEKVLVEEIENNKDLDNKNIVEKAKDHLEVNDQSSDEEFLSADEDVVSQEAKEPGLVESPLRTPPKVGYNLDFDDLEAMNPFQTKVCVQNSPDLSGNDKQKLNSEKIVEKKESKMNEVPEAKQELTEVPKEVKKPSSEINGDASVPLADNKVVESNDNDLDQNMGPDKKADSNDKEMTLPCQKSEELAQAQSPPLPQRGTYNLDNLDSMDPFKVKTQIMNSPAGCQREERQATVEETDPFNPNKQIANSPVLKASKKESETPSQQNQSAIKNTEEDETEPSKPKIAKTKKTKPKAQKTESVINLPENLDELDPFKSGNQIMNSPPIKSGGCYEPLPDDLDALDPFKPKKQVMNSPLSQEKPHSNVNNIDEHERKLESESKADDLLDNETLEPFKQMKNSPVANGVPDTLNETDPFKPKKQILNSPDKQDAYDVLPENLAGIDPFKPSNQMVNSPLKENVDNKNESEIADEIDVFKSAQKIMDSPMAKAAIDESSFPTSLEDADPFKPKSQIANSPDKGLINLPENFDEIDPFQPRKQTLNSPKGGNDKDLPFDIDNIDPFKPKTQVPNSPDLITDLPDSFDDIDPFKPKNQMKNSPVSKEKNDLSDKTSETVKIDTEKASDAFDDIDPFKPKHQMQNSPKQALEDNLDSVNPFMSKNQLQNSPKKGLDDNFDSVDPFKPRQQMLNSPLGRRLKASSGTPKTVLSPFLNRNNRLPATPEETLSDDGEVMEVQGVTRRGAAGSTNAQGFDFDESEFVAASEVFKDPGVWEMLEQFGNTASTSSQDSALSRMSLYVKFDPLVEGTSRLSTNARRISIRPKQLEKVKEFGLEDTFLLLGTPPKKKRQSMNVSQLRHTPVSSNGVPVQGHRPRELNMEQGAVDLIMALSPEGDSLTPSSQRSQPTSLLPTLDDEEGGSGLFEELKYTNSDLRRFRNDLKLEFQGQLIVEKKEWSKKEQQYEDMLKEARAALDAKKKEVQEIAKACVMFEETVEKMKAKQEKEREETNNVNKENQQLREDIQGVENAFSDLHRRYEKLKMVVEGNLKNEDTLKKYASDLKGKLKSSEEKYTTLKKTAEEKITKSTQEIAKLKHEVSSDTNKHDAAKKVMTMKIESLERQLQQKIEENKNLTEICDQLIQKAEN